MRQGDLALGGGSILLENHGGAGCGGPYGLCLLLARFLSGFLRALDLLLQCFRAGLRGVFDNLANVVGHGSPFEYRPGNHTADEANRVNAANLANPRHPRHPRHPRQPASPAQGFKLGSRATGGGGPLAAVAHSRRHPLDAPFPRSPARASPRARHPDRIASSFGRRPDRFAFSAPYPSTVSPHFGSNR